MSIDWINILNIFRDNIFRIEIILAFWNEKLILNDIMKDYQYFMFRLFNMKGF